MFLKRFVHFISLFFLLGAGLLSFFLILSGAKHSGTLKEFYWFQANTEGFNDASRITRWYNYDYCGWANNENFNCSNKAPAKPFSPRDNFGTSPNIPSTFLDHRNTYYYLSRVAWAMLLISFFFIMITIIPSIVTIFKVFNCLSIFSTVSTWLAFFFMLLAACLYTGCYAKAKKGFHDGNRTAKMGPRNFGFIWTTVFLLLLISIWSTITAFTHDKDKKYKYNSEEPEMYANYPVTNEAGQAVDSVSPPPVNQYRISSPTPITEPVLEAQKPLDSNHVDGAPGVGYAPFTSINKNKGNLSDTVRRGTGNTPDPDSAMLD